MTSSDYIMNLDGFSIPGVWIRMLLHYYILHLSASLLVLWPRNFEYPGPFLGV